MLCRLQNDSGLWTSVFCLSVLRWGGGGRGGGIGVCVWGGGDAELKLENTAITFEEKREQGRIQIRFCL